MQQSLRVIRESVHLTQEEVAELLGVSRSYYAELEKGLKSPSLAVLRRFIDLFGPQALGFFLPAKSLEADTSRQNTTFPWR